MLSKVCICKMFIHRQRKKHQFFHLKAFQVCCQARVLDPDLLKSKISIKRGTRADITIKMHQPTAQSITFFQVRTYLSLFELDSKAAISYLPIQSKLMIIESLVEL